MSRLGGAVMVCGTASDVGKSRIVAGLCRILVRRGVRVAPFKAQNMSLNSYVTPSGHEIARSQAHQAAAARIAPEVAMNPILLKPTAPLRSQVVVMGRPVGDVEAGAYLANRHRLASTVASALAELRSRYDVVVAEGAGGAAEINLLDGDLVNLPLARAAAIPAILVGDIERGGVFASIYGTAALLPGELRSQLKGFVINKLRGDERLLAPGIAELERRCGLPCLGVVPHLGDLAVDAEDSLALDRPRPGGSAGVPAPAGGDVLDVAVVRLPHLSNFTDFDPLGVEEGVAVRYVDRAGAVGDADLVVLPGSKATVDDLAWLRARHLDGAIRAAHRRGATVLGICAGFQMLGTSIVDDVESQTGEVAGLGLVGARTTFSPEKVTRLRRGVDRSGSDVAGYEIHHGIPAAADAEGFPWFSLDGGTDDEGVEGSSTGVWATSLHGILESDGLRHRLLGEVGRRRGKRFVATEEPFESRRQAEIDQMADALEAHLDIDAVLATSAEAVR